jgi:hypothetical protein
MAYMDQNRTDSNPNKLVRHAWDGLSDKFIVAAILTRAVVFCSLIGPLRFVMNALARRPDLEKILDVVDEAITELHELRSLGYFREKLAAAFPLWHTSLMRYEARFLKSHQAVWDLVQQPEYRDIVSRFLRSAAHDMAESLTRNMKRDAAASLNPNVARAPMNTDQTEGGFGQFDWFSFMTNASIVAVMGASLATRNHSLQGEVEIKQRLHERALRKRKRGMGDEAVEDSSKWDIVNYNSVPKEISRPVLSYLLKKENFGRLCGGKGGDHDRQLGEQAEEDLSRKTAEVKLAYTKHMTKVAKHQLWIQRAVTERADSVATLKKMLKKQTCNDNKLKVLQFQIRIRMELDGID